MHPFPRLRFGTLPLLLTVLCLLAALPATATRWTELAGLRDELDHEPADDQRKARD